MRRLIVCCDGTWNRADWEGGTATNIVRLARAIRPNGANTVPQILYYRQGVGTGNRVDRLLGGGFGLGLSENLRDAYAFLANNYEDGDQIFLIGFSRGAYTARSLGGLIGTVGLLRKQQMGGFLDAWSFHRLSPAARAARQTEFDSLFPGRRQKVPIRCIAVFDTVGAEGVPDNRITAKWHPCKSLYKFHNVQLGDHVEYAFHALAVDEKRPPFQPVVWERSDTAPSTQVLKQMWFAGVHSDVGGGYVDRGSSDVALIWMAAQLVEHGLLDLDAESLTDELDKSNPYGESILHNSLSLIYATLFRPRSRAVCRTNTEFVHHTVVDRIKRGDYRDLDFLREYSSRVAQPTQYEKVLSGYPAATLHVRRAFITGETTFCEKLVRWIMGR